MKLIPLVTKINDIAKKCGKKEIHTHKHTHRTTTSPLWCMCHVLINLHATHLVPAIIFHLLVLKDICNKSWPYPGGFGGCV